MNKRFVHTVLAAGLLVAAAVLLGSTSTAQASNAAGCSLTPTNGPVTRFLFKGTDIGPYRLTVPDGLIGSVPLLVDLHGGGGSAESYEFITQWPDYAMRKKSFILAAPNSEVYGQWNFQQGSIDVSFIKAMVADLASTYCLDARRIYVSGHSDGGIMTDRMVCDAARTFAAAAPYAGAPATLLGSPCTPTRPVPMEFFHGDSDFVAPVSIQEQNRDTWVQREHCATTPARVTDTYGYTDTYGSCDGGSVIKWRLLKDQFHNWPTGAAGEDMRDRMLAFFNAHPMP